MRFLILGGSGRVGKLAVQEALSRGHKVTALVRNEASLASLATSEGTEGNSLTIVKGSPTDNADMEKAFTAVPGEVPSAVIVALNNSRESDSPFAKPTSPPTLMEDAHVAALESMKKHGTSKIVTLQAQGVGESYSSLFWIMKLLVRYSNFGFGYRDHEKVDDVVKKTGLNFVFARPSRFVDGPAKPIKFYGDKGKGIGSFSSITRSSVANFLIEAAEKGTWDGTTPVISN